MAINKRFASEDFVNDAASAASYLNIIETVGGDTLTWDGNTEGVYNVSGMSYLVSDVVPTLEDLQKGGCYTWKNGASRWFSSSDIIDASSLGIGNDCAFVLYNGLPMFGIAFKEGASAVFQLDGQTIPLTFEKAGVYFSYNYTNNSPVIVSIALNDYDGFPKDVIKEDYIPFNGVKIKKFRTLPSWDWLIEHKDKIFGVIFYDNGTDAFFSLHRIDYFNEINYFEFSRDMKSVEVDRSTHEISGWGHTSTLRIYQDKMISDGFNYAITKDGMSDLSALWSDYTNDDFLQEQYTLDILYRD